MQNYFTIFMCDLCDFHDELPGWITDNTSDEFSDIDPVKFACRVSSVVMSLQENHFEVIPSFDVGIDEDSEYNEKAVILVGLKNGESIEVQLFLNDYMYIVSSKEVPGVGESKFTEEYGKYLKYFGGGQKGNWELEASKFLEKTLEVHKSGHMTSKISAKSLHHARDEALD